MINMNERVFKTVSGAAVMNLVLGIVVLAAGITSGVLLLINGAKLMKSKNDMII